MNPIIYDIVTFLLNLVPDSYLGFILYGVAIYSIIKLFKKLRKNKSNTASQKARPSS